MLFYSTAIDTVPPDRRKEGLASETGLERLAKRDQTNAV